MATTSTIGTSSRDYSTIAAWLAAFTTGGWIGECYNDSEFTVTAVIDFSGHATGASDYIILRTATGQSFRDHASVQSNALRYNQSNGVGIRRTSGYGNTITVAESYVTLAKLQIANTSVSPGFVYDCSSISTDVLVDSCIIEGNSTSAGGTYIHSQRSGGVINSTIVNRGTNGNGLSFGYANGTPYAVNCTIVRPNTPGGTAITAGSGAWTVKNCALFGFTTLNSGGTAGGGNNCSDLAIGFGSSNQASKTFANQFQNVTDATRDFRAKSGGDIIDNAATDTTNVPSATDIVATSRPQGSAWDIGAWELVSGGGGGTAARRLALLGVG